MTKRKERARQTTLEPVYTTVLGGHIMTLYSRGVQDGSHLFRIRYKNNNATMASKAKTVQRTQVLNCPTKLPWGISNAQDVCYLPHANGAYMNG